MLEHRITISILVKSKPSLKPYCISGWTSSGSLADVHQGTSAPGHQCFGANRIPGWVREKEKLHDSWHCQWSDFRNHMSQLNMAFINLNYGTAMYSRSNLGSFFFHWIVMFPWELGVHLKMERLFPLFTLHAPQTKCQWNVVNLFMPWGPIFGVYEVRRVGLAINTWFWDFQDVNIGLFSSICLRMPSLNPI